MATWTRQLTGTAPSATDADIIQAAALDNGTAPVDFDPTAVNSVRIQWTLAVTAGTFSSGGGSDVFNPIENPQLEDSTGTQLAQPVAGTLANLQSGTTTVSGDATDNSPNLTRSTAQWESADVDGDGTGLWASHTQNKGPDGVTVTLTALTVTIDYTPASTTQNLDPSTLSITPSFPTAQIDQQIQGVLLSVTPTFGTATIKETQTITGVTLSVTPTFGTATLIQEQFLTATLLGVTPTFPTATLIQEQFLEATLLTVATTFPFATINQQIQGALLSVTPTFPTANIKEIQLLTSTLVSLTPSFPTAQLNQSINASLLSVSPTFPTATLGTAVYPSTLSVSPTFPTATITDVYDITGVTHSVTVTFPAAEVEGAGTIQDIQPTVLSVSATFPTAKLGITVEGVLLSVVATFPAATLRSQIVGSLLTVTPSFGGATLDSVYDVDGGALAVSPTFGTATIALGDQFIEPTLFSVVVTFPRSNLLDSGTPLTPSDTEAQGIAQEMAAARGLSGDLDWLGSLNALNGGTNLDKLGVLVALGATPGSDVLKALEQLAFDGQGPGDFNELMRRWAESGNF